MIKPVYHKDKVQSWQDSDDILHVVLFHSEPFKVVCKKRAMWGYRPKYVDINSIDCEVCLQALKGNDVV